MNFNPLPPHGGRPHAFPSLALDLIFQSTPSTRRETRAVLLGQSSQRISIHSLHTEGDDGILTAAYYLGSISIHSLHTEGDECYVDYPAAIKKFQSTPSTRRETVEKVYETLRKAFQSTPSTRRETSGTGAGQPLGILFQSTPSTRRETEDHRSPNRVKNISIHSLHTEGDTWCTRQTASGAEFQSTPSTRRETRNNRINIVIGDISIHSLHTEGDSPRARRSISMTISIHSLHTEGDNAAATTGG